MIRVAMKTQSDIEDYLFWCADRYISYRPRTEYELRRYLTQKLKKKQLIEEHEQEVYICKIFKKLAAEGRLNDAQFLEWFVDDRQYFRPRGLRRLKQELTQKGIKKDLIDTYFSTHVIDEVPHIIDILSKKFFLYGQQPQAHLLTTSRPDPFIQKIINHLLRRGFSYDAIKTAFEEFIKKK